MHVLVALAAMDVVRVTGSTPRVLLEKGLRFERLSAIEVSASFVSYAAAIFTAWRWPEQGIWALVGQRGVEVLLRVIGFWAVHPVKISRAVDPAVTRWMFLSFGWPLWIGSAFFVVTFQSPEFLVGRLLGLEALGLYSTALRLATLPRDLVSFVPRVVSPIYSHLQRDRAALAAVFEKVQGTLIRVVVLVIVPLAVLVPDLLELFGLLQKWQGVVPVFRALCVYALSYAAFVNVPSLATVGLGMPKLHFKVQVLQGATVVALCPLLTWLYGALGTAVAMDAMMFSSTAVLWWLVSRQMPVRLGRIFVPPLLAGAIAAAAGLLVCWLLLSLPLWMRLPVELCSILAAYFALLFALEGALLWRRVIEFRNLLLRQA
jgi:O-antigen/teichoic acid export membrane protein